MMILFYTFDDDQQIAYSKACKGLIRGFPADPLIQSRNFTRSFGQHGPTATMESKGIK